MTKKLSPEKQAEMQAQIDLLQQMVDTQRQWIAVCEQQIEAYKDRVEELEAQLANK